MHSSVEPNLVASSQFAQKPTLSSYDSAQEFSLAHWLEVRRLVKLAEREDIESKSDVFDDSLLVSYRSRKIATASAKLPRCRSFHGS